MTNQNDLNNRRKATSSRGPFEIWENPAMSEPVPAGSPMGKELIGELIKEYDISNLSEKYGEGIAREKIAELLESYGDGVSTTLLFAQDGENGMNLTHAWFGPNLRLFRHSHPRYSDCMYYVMAGELIVGQRRLGPGSGFFIPANQPYRLAAGPQGVEILEFRADGFGNPEDADTKIEEHSLEDIQSLIDNSNANRHLWKAPAHIGDTGRAIPES